MITLRDQIKAVAECRAHEKARNAIVDAARREFEIEHQAILDAAAIAGQSRAEAENMLRQTIVAEYEETGNKKPAPGCGIRETTSYLYDADEALKWAMFHATALQLDKKAFGEVCKSERLRPAFVEASVTPQATISTDLTVALAEIAVAEAA